MNANELIQHATQARTRAYAPYSNFSVGAALLTKDKKIFYGCNVENAAYSLCLCAERNAISAAVAAGYAPGSFDMIAVIADTEDVISPCGACRQVMLELGGQNLRVILANLQSKVRETTAADLLPAAFSSTHLTTK